MTKRNFFGVMAVAAAVALTASALVASNMGFKLNYTLAAAGTASGTNTLALPDNRQSGLNNAKNLMDDIGFANAQSVSHYLTATDGLESYTGRKGCPTCVNFSLAVGEGLYVKMGTAVNYIVVGSDDPAASYSFLQGSGGSSGTTLFAYNYHQTAANAKALMDDIGFANTQSVTRYLTATDGQVSYTGRKGCPTCANFSLTPGEAYFVKMGTTVNYVPSHY